MYFFLEEEVRLSRHSRGECCANSIENQGDPQHVGGQIHEGEDGSAEEAMRSNEKPEEAVAPLRSWLSKEIYQEYCESAMEVEDVFVDKNISMYGGEYYGQPMEDRAELERKRDQIKQDVEFLDKMSYLSGQAEVQCQRKAEFVQV